SASNTKNEILEAYNELLKKLEGQKPGQPKEIKEKEERENVLKNAVSINKEGIIKQIAGLKISLNTELEKVEEALVAESKKLLQVQEAIQIQEQRLQDLYGINATADSMAVMLSLQREKKENFEKEMEQKQKQLDYEITETRQKWDKEKKESEQLTKEEKERLMKQRKRDEEEYSYSLEIARKKDANVYSQKKETLEKELTDKKTKFEQEIKSREQAVINAETELTDLREKSVSFPKLIEQSVKEAVADNTAKLQTTYKFESQLKSKESESEVKLRDQEIASLKAKIKDIEIQLAQSFSKAEQADKSAKDIAIRAIESSANYKIIDRIKEPKDDSGK
ncbi:MAG: hypothetical protein JW787_11025, partial [Sedimentisphaerales bacterium]|nr:hypothetical protein [Sedimentisphaerales bacterium]